MYNTSLSKDQQENPHLVLVLNSSGPAQILTALQGPFANQSQKKVTGIKMPSHSQVTFLTYVDRNVVASKQLLQRFLRHSHSLVTFLLNVGKCGCKQKVKLKFPTALQKNVYSF